MKILLTGSSGFLGSSLCQKFAVDGHEVVAVSRQDSSSCPTAVRKVITDACIGEFEWPDDVLKGVDVIVHAAARAHKLSDTVSDPLHEFRKVNVQGTVRLAKKAAQSGVKRFVFISSIGVLGNNNTTPFTENDKPQPHDDYAVSKYEAEMALKELSAESGLEVVIIRPPLVYGPNAPGNFGSLLKWVKRMMPLPLGSIYNQRSFVALENLVDFIDLCADRDQSPAAANQVFLISDGEDVSTTELLKRIAKAYDKPSMLIPFPMGLMRWGATLFGKKKLVARLFGSLRVDSSKARTRLNWNPVVTMDEQLAKIARSDSE